jgi:hypothetical protein
MVSLPADWAFSVDHAQAGTPSYRQKATPVAS